MNVKLIILICLLIGSNGMQHGENNTYTLSALQAHNGSLSSIEKHTDASAKSSDDGNDLGFMSQLNNLIFGPNDDSEPSDTRPSLNYAVAPPVPHAPLAPIAPPAQRNKFYDECNPCNKEPWVPMIPYYAHNQLIDFSTSNSNNPHKQHHIQSDSYGAPVVNQGYHQQHAPSYNLPSHNLDNYKPPHSSASQDLYGPPISVKPNYGAPLPPLQPPILDNYGPPPAKYGPPSVSLASHSQSPAPSITYGGPPAPGNYGPPKAPFKHDLALPAPAFSAASVVNEAPAVAAPASIPAVDTSSFGNHYGQPKPIFRIPSTNYGPPVNHHTYAVPKPGYLLGKAPRQIRPPFQPFGPRSRQPAYKYIPLNKNKPNNPQAIFKPPLSPLGYNPIGSMLNPFGSVVNLGPPPHNFDIKPQITNSEYLPPQDELPIATGHNAEPIALPNLSSRPIAPLHNPANFYDNFPQPDSHVEVPYEKNVEIQPSIPVAHFLASVEHPITVIRSPILDVNVANASSPGDSFYTTMPAQVGANDNVYQPMYNPISNSDNDHDDKLSDHPIVVEDTHVAAATNRNNTFSKINYLHTKQVPDDFLQQILNGIRSQFTSPPSTSMQPPPIGTSPWLAPSSLEPSQYAENQSTKKPKQIQIIIPYTTNNDYDKRKSAIPVKKLLPEQHDVTYRSTEIKKLDEPARIQAATKSIKDLFTNKNKESSDITHLPFDIINLQKNIDGWTEQEYSKTFFSSASTSSATSTTKFIPSKRIPDDYLTTLPYEISEATITSPAPYSTFTYVDHEAAGSNNREYLQSNLIATTDPSTTQKVPKVIKEEKHWEKIHIAVSPLTKEKIYVVTPQPTEATAIWRQPREKNRNSTFSISIIPMRNKTLETNGVRVVLSEWPHLINNLATVAKSTASTATVPPPPTSKHPLFGLMDLPSYTPPGNSTIETYAGHSKVINVATVALKKRSTQEEKKVTSTMNSATPD